ncbi:MAG: SAM-dependent chlorinase/fluorinase [Desulfotignum sp.]
MHTFTPGPITLLTDFGDIDPFVGILKGVILSINPGAVIVDLCHKVPPRDIGYGAVMLDTAMDYFPGGTIFCAVVDPGVGSLRRPVLVETCDYFMVGPDNGLLWQAARRNSIKNVVHLTRSRYFLSCVSSTFHGRDIFAPVAAHLSTGIAPAAFGEPAKELIRFVPDAPEPVDKGLLLTVRHIDTFGNIGLNLTRENFKPFVDKGFCLQIRDTAITGYYQTYASAPDNQPFVLTASNGYLEIAVKNGHAAKMLTVSRQDKILLMEKGNTASNDI